MVLPIGLCNPEAKTDGGPRAGGAQSAGRIRPAVISAAIISTKKSLTRSGCRPGFTSSLLEVSGWLSSETLYNIAAATMDETALASNRDDLKIICIFRVDSGIRWAADVNSAHEQPSRRQYSTRSGDRGSPGPFDALRIGERDRIGFNRLASTTPALFRA